VVRNNERIPTGDELRAACDNLVADAQQLRRIAGLNILRAAHIADVNGDTEVAKLLVSEAAVMMSVASAIEYLFVPESDDGSS